MKSVISPRTKSKAANFFSIFLLVPLTLSLAVFCQTGLAQATQLSLVDIITALRSKKATFDEKNKLLADGVKQRGITFSINAELEKELRLAGAGNDLIEAIRQKSPVVKPSPTPTPKVDPTPAPTPRPPDAAFYKNRANANFVMGEYDSAITDYNKAIELDAKDSTVYFSRGLAFYNKKDFNRAITDYDKVIELDPEESMAYFSRGNAFEKAGNLEKAFSDYKKAFELDSTNESAKNSLQRVQALMPKPQPATPNKTESSAQNKEAAAVQSKETASATGSPVSNEPVNIGSLKELAVRLVTPAYPAFERQRRVEGLVVVEIVLDEEGKVISAKATSGPRSLRQAGEVAAERSKFKPATVDGKPVKAVGFVTYNFKL